MLHVPTLLLATTLTPANTPWQRLQPKTRLLCGLLWVLGLTLIPAGNWGLYALYTLILGLVIRITQVSAHQIARHLQVEIPLVATIVLSVLFGGQGQVLMRWGWLMIGDQALVHTLSLMLKLILSLLFWKIITLTTAPFPLIQALRTLGCPELVVSIAAMMLRYTELLVQEQLRMQQAILARGCKPSTLSWQVWGNLLGVLFLRSYGRGERISQAMQARGFTGHLIVDNMQPWQLIELLALSSLSGLVLGTALCIR